MEHDRAVCESSRPEIRRRIQTQHFLHVGIRKARHIRSHEAVHLLRSRDIRIAEQRGIVIGPANDHRDVGEPVLSHKCGWCVRDEVSVYDRQPIVALILSYTRGMGDELGVQQLLHGKAAETGYVLWRVERIVRAGRYGPCPNHRVPSRVARDTWHDDWQC